MSESSHLDQIGVRVRTCTVDGATEVYVGADMTVDELLRAISFYVPGRGRLAEALVLRFVVDET